MSSTKEVLRPVPLAPLVLALGLALSAGTAWYVHDAARTRAQVEFESRARIVADVVARRVEGWAEVLRGVRALFLAAAPVSRDEFMRHAQVLALPQRHQGFMALEFVRYVPQAHKAAFEEAVRGDASVQPGGYPQFAIRPPDQRPDYYVIDYVEPMAGNEAVFGFDIASVPERRRAMEQARDTGRMVASGQLQFQQQRSPQPGLVLREPVYRPFMPLETVEQRREAFVGLAQVVLRLGDFLEATLSGELLQRLDLRLFDLGPVVPPDRAAAMAVMEPLLAPPPTAQLLYDSLVARQRHEPGPGLTQVLRLPVGDRAWLLEFHERPSGAGTLLVLLVLLAGASASVLLYRLLRLQQRLRVELASRVTARTAELATANAALKASEQRLELALAGADLGLWDWNVATGTLAWNARWLAMRGCSVSDLLPSVGTWKGLIHPEDRDAMQAALDAHLQGRSAAYVAEYRVGTGALPWRWVLDAGRVVERDENGRPLRMAGTNLDISERKHAEENRAAREAAERASRAKSEFLARTSHELRTPLNAILGFAQMMRLDVREPLPQAQAQRLHQIQGAGEHLLNMINEMLDLTGIESGSVRLALAPVALAPLARECLQGLEPLAQAAGVELRAELLPEAPQQVLADALRLREVLINLLSNAVKYNRRGGWVRLSAQPVGAGCVAIAVEDTGRGLSDAQLAQLFQPFNRLGAERTGIEGTGLGLVIAQRLAQLMQGSLRAARREGGGSVFTLELPAAPAASMEPAVAAAQASPGWTAAALPGAVPAPAAADAAGPSSGRPAPEGACGAGLAPAGEAVPVVRAVLTAAGGLAVQGPLAAAEPAAPSADAANLPAPQSGAAVDAPAQALVLYIEDEPVNALLVQHVLGLRPDCVLHVAQDGTSGLAMARSEHPALVLIDLNLPDMSGHEVLARLRADPATRGLRCVALTADAMPDNVERALAGGFDDFWSKPIEVQSFLAGLDRQLALARGAPAQGVALGC